MKKYKKIVALVGLVGALAITPAALAADVQHTATIGGTVASVTPVGAKVNEGDVLLTVNALAGPMPATRASAGGTVKAVMVQPGAQVQPGEVVVIVESK
jgi:biotin carboxyl carrier protein